MTSQVRVLINVTVVWFSQKILVEGTDQAFNEDIKSGNSRRRIQMNNTFQDDRH